LAKYRLRPVVLDAKVTEIRHFGPATLLEANSIEAARAEVDRMAPPHGGNCLQILNEDDSVATHRMVGAGINDGWH
jgi:hypothetical protein